MNKGEQPKEEEAQPPAMGGMLITMLFMIYIMINPGMRDGMGNMAGSILEPYIGFGGEYPIITIFVAGLIMITQTQHCD
jgi:uncharacterized membrane protein (DUF106 family)